MTQQEGQGVLAQQEFNMRMKDIVETCEIMFDTPENLIERLHLSMEEVLLALWETKSDEIIDLIIEYKDALDKKVEEEYNEFN